MKAIEFEGVKYNLTEYEDTPTTRSYKKRRKGKYWDETYQRNVTKDEIDEVKKAILHVEGNYIPTTEGIANQTGVEIRDVQSILRIMKKKLNIVTPERTKGHKVIYRLKSDTESQMD